MIGQTNAVLVETLAAVCAWTANDVRLKVQQAEKLITKPRASKVMCRVLALLAAGSEPLAVSEEQDFWHEEVGDGKGHVRP